jgi:broad specificity phosphatase PhoE
MGVVLLVRHGQASWGAEDYDRLSDLGVRQSGVLGQALAARGVRPDVVVRGSMRRHRETTDAAVAGAGWDGEVVQDARWDEFDHLSTVTGGAGFPDVAGESYDDRVRRFEAGIERWAAGRHDADYVEAFPAFRARVEAALESVLGSLDPRATAVVFTSGGPVSWVTARLADGGVPAWTRLSKVVVNSSVTKVLVGRRGPTLISFNDHSHLEAAAPSASAPLITYR